MVKKIGNLYSVFDTDDCTEELARYSEIEKLIENSIEVRDLCPSCIELVRDFLYCVYYNDEKRYIEFMVIHAESGEVINGVIKYLPKGVSLNNIDAVSLDVGEYLDSNDMASITIEVPVYVSDTGKLSIDFVVCRDTASFIEVSDNWH